VVSHKQSENINWDAHDAIANTLAVAVRLRVPRQFPGVVFPPNIDAKL
jgi:hypothetical protein